jgi:ketosteroid isomerase-like protein
LVERYEAAWHAKDAAAFLACHTEDAVWEVPLFYPDGIARGHAAIRAECERAWRAMNYQTHDLFVSLDGSRAAQWWTGRFRLTGPIDPPGYAPTNQPVEMTRVSVWELRGDRLSRVSEYFDALGPVRQIGLIPGPATLGERAGVLLRHVSARRMRRKAGA